MEKLEHFAEVVMRARLMGAVRTLSPDELVRLRQNAAALGYNIDTSACGRAACPAEIRRIAEAVADGIREAGLEGAKHV
jgi:hypothetical protein